MKFKNNEKNPLTSIIKEFEDLPPSIILMIILQAFILHYFYFFYLLIFFVIFWNEILNIWLRKTLNYDLPIVYNLDKYGMVSVTWKEVIEFFLLKFPQISAFIPLYIITTKEKPKKIELKTLFFNLILSRVFIPLNLLYLSKNLLLIYKDTVHSVVWQQKYKIYWPSIFLYNFLLILPQHFSEKWGYICWVFKEYKLYENKTNGPMWTETSSQLVSTATKLTSVVTRKGVHTAISHGPEIATVFTHTKILPTQNKILVNPNITISEIVPLQYGYLQITNQIPLTSLNFLKNNNIYSRFDACEFTHTLNLHNTLINKNECILYRNTQLVESGKIVNNSLAELKCHSGVLFELYLNELKDEYMFYMKKKFPHLNQESLDAEIKNLILLRATIPLKDRYKIIYSNIENSNIPFKEKMLDRLIELKNTPFNPYT